MKELKLSRRIRDGIFELHHYIGDTRKRTSLKTKDENEARLKFTKITGLPAPVKKNNGIP